ncbi:hypothetical protein GCM10010168_84260 [Actinoplanes ianthinogenes]|uniref:Lipoprotein n=1 Tax=Actinoplanes ianthinogenes TaxID=122358 RepID=A0ABM7M0A6_9ACTN|nr:hypothetical protein [Actinoplanes ianthinogenes]BCJ45000.1 hypothetical protein Aiant_56570 [Actinoplanes ianthinogenes]GGR52472.1 hypothetical protein GCM10010168_84260 [Actinoplanes ianthinogenes]
MWQRGTLLVVAVLAATVSGCGKPAGPFRLGEAPPATPVSVGKPGDDGLVMMAQWPSACDLITESDARAIIPSAVKVESTDEPVTYLDATLGASSQKKPDGACETLVYFPESSMEEDDPGLRLKIKVRAFGSAKVLKKEYTEKFKERKKDEACPPELVKKAKLTDCTHDVTGYEILKNGAWFDVGAIFFDLGEDVKIEGQPDGTDAKAYWEAQGLPRFVEAVSHHLP